MPTHTETVTVIAGHELRSAIRGKMVPAFAALFSILAVGIALAGLGATGRIVVQGFTRTTVSLLTLALYLLPLLGAILGAAAFGDEDGATELLLAQPIGRIEALLGRAAGLYAALAGVALAGFGAAGVLIAATAGTHGMGGYILSALGATAVGFAGLGCGILLGVLARRRTTAVGWALAAWFALAILYDLAAIGVLQIAGNGEPGPWGVALLAAHPNDGVRAIAHGGRGAAGRRGPTGAALQRLMGPGKGALIVTTAVALWVALPPAIAALRYQRRDF